MLDDRVCDVTDLVAHVDKTPGKIHVRAVLEIFVKAAHSIEHLAAECEIYCCCLAQVRDLLGLLGGEFPAPLSRRVLRGARDDALVLPKRRYQGCQPSRPRTTARVCKHDDVAAGFAYSDIPLVRNGYPHVRRWLEV